MSEDLVTNGFSLAGQEPWLQRGTVRDNILFGKELDEQFYMQVVYACALTQDFKVTIFTRMVTNFLSKKL